MQRNNTRIAQKMYYCNPDQAANGVLRTLPIVTLIRRFKVIMDLIGQVTYNIIYLYELELCQISWQYDKY